MSLPALGLVFFGREAVRSNAQRLGLAVRLALQLQPTSFSET